MIIKNETQLRCYREACQISTEILWQLHQATRVGVLPIAIDRLAMQLCEKYQVKPAFIGVGKKPNKYRYATCIAVNDTVVHGIPSATEVLKEGDIVKVDFGITHQSYVTDHCFCVGLQPISAEKISFIKLSQSAIEKAADQAVLGNQVGDISHTLQATVEAAGYQVAREFTGHGIGYALHESPSVPVFGEVGTGPQLEVGMVLCVEAQVLAGENTIFFEDDGWTVKTMDGQPAAMFEYMVMVAEKEPEYLTDTRNWPLLV